MCAPVRTDEGALVGASPRQAHDLNAAAHRPRTRAGGQADVSGQDDARDAVLGDGGGRQRAGCVDEDAARFDVDARSIAADVEDAIGLACGFVAGPGDPRVDADASEGFLIVNILGRQVGDARARIDGRGGDSIDGIGQALLAWCREHESGSDSRVSQTCSGGVPVKIEQSGVGEDARIRLGSEAWASSSIMGGRRCRARPVMRAPRRSRGRGQLRGWWLTRSRSCPGRSYRRLSRKSDILPLCLLVGGALFGYWRSDVTFPLIAGARHAEQSENTERQTVH